MKSPTLPIFVESSLALVGFILLITLMSSLELNAKDNPLKTAPNQDLPQVVAPESNAR